MEVPSRGRCLVRERARGLQHVVALRKERLVLVQPRPQLAKEPVCLAWPQRVHRGLVAAPARRGDAEPFCIPKRFVGGMSEEEWRRDIREEWVSERRRRRMPLIYMKNGSVTYGKYGCE